MSGQAKTKTAAAITPEMTTPGFTFPDINLDCGLMRRSIHHQPIGHNKDSDNDWQYMMSGPSTKHQPKVAARMSNLTPYMLPTAINLMKFKQKLWVVLGMGPIQPPNMSRTDFKTYKYKHAHYMEWSGYEALVVEMLHEKFLSILVDKVHKKFG
eukprot:jgi/Psemu1/4031/gm1.4031_g